MKKLFCIAALALALVGCKTHSNFIVVTSGTTVGFDVSEAPASASPQATLAYKRVEVAIVPVTTNGTAPDVLMNFDFKTAIFTSGGGIHSRLAVGEHATTQVPASLLMMKNEDGTQPTNAALMSLLQQLTTKTNK